MDSNCNLTTRDILAAGPVSKQGSCCNLTTPDFLSSGRPSQQAAGLLLQSVHMRFCGDRPSKRLQDSNCNLTTPFLGGRPSEQAAG